MSYTMSIAERIYQQVKTLPESAAREILDFAEFLGSKLAREAGSHGSAQGGNPDRDEDSGNQWPDAVLAFEGVPDMPPFEQGRRPLLPPAVDPVS